jgi:hypothetical protein
MSGGREFVEELAQCFDDMDTGTEAAILFMKILNSDFYTHAEIGRILGRAKKEIDRLSKNPEQQIRVRKMREDSVGLFQPEDGMLEWNQKDMES